MRELLGVALLGTQTLLLIPIIWHSFRARTANGMSLMGEMIWASAGIGWFVYALMIDSLTIIASGLIAFLGCGILTIIIWSRTSKKKQQHAVLVTSIATITGTLMGVFAGVEGLALALSIFGVVQFIPHLWTTTRVLRGKETSEGVSTVGASLRAVYTGGWALYAAGWVVWGTGSEDTQWPLFVWGVAGVIAFLSQTVTTVVERRRNGKPVTI